MMREQRKLAETYYQRVADELVLQHGEHAREAKVSSRKISTFTESDNEILIPSCLSPAVTVVLVQSPARVRSAVRRYGRILFDGLCPTLGKPLSTPTTVSYPVNSRRSHAHQ